ncbi:MAG: hypothetical protein A2201_05800 [Alicyclobacillus sp. RIFOXYA1_FULL_53_8]|nr:MAG: hypothetical protein A2201_05800 [Alicyclobacillus sp. RIFOXYA1_FULL_53_8]
MLAVVYGNRYVEGLAARWHGRVRRGGTRPIIAIQKVTIRRFGIRFYLNKHHFVIYLAVRRHEEGRNGAS